MVAVPFVVAVVSIVFLALIVVLLSYLAFSGPSRDLTSTGLVEDDPSTAD